MTEEARIALYKSILVSFMNYKDGKVYNKETQFTQEQLRAIRPEDLLKWFQFRVYGTDNPEKEGARPTNARKASLEHYKKAISFFMPEQQEAWNVENGTGNPTKSIPINDFIRFVGQKEANKEGKAGQERRPLEPAEFEQTLSMLYETADIRQRYMVTALLKVQFHLIRRFDDTFQMLWSDLQPNPDYKYTIQTRMRWSKNVQGAEEEEDAPDQILLGAKDPYYCVMLGLALYGEVCGAAGIIKPESRFLFGHTGNPESNKEFASTALSSLWKSDKFEVAQVDGAIGTPSIRKYASSRAQQAGCSNQEVEFRGGWSTKRRIPKRSKGVRMPYPDGRVAASLCIGGTIKYVVRPGLGITMEWISKFVIPSFVKVKGDQLSADVMWNLGLALLWACYDNTVVPLVPYNIRRRVQENFPTKGLVAGVNPVLRLELAVTCKEGSLHIDEIHTNQMHLDAQPLPDPGIAGDTAGTGNALTYNQFTILYSQIQLMRREFKEYFDRAQAEAQARHDSLTRELKLLQDAIAGRQQVQGQDNQNQNTAVATRLQPVQGIVTANVQNSNSNNQQNKNISVGGNAPLQHAASRSFNANMNINSVTSPQPMLQPVTWNNHGHGSNYYWTVYDTQEIDPKATLSNHPKTLGLLWQEYEFGIAGRKPARLFTPAERGRCKHVYCRRKVVWTRIRKLIQAGHTPQSAIERIYNEYGRNSPVTKIINQIMKEKKEQSRKKG